MNHMTFMALLVSAPLTLTPVIASSAQEASHTPQGLSAAQTAELHQLLGGDTKISLVVKLHFLKEQLGGKSPTILGRTAELQKTLGSTDPLSTSLDGLKRFIGLAGPLVTDLAQRLVELRHNVAQSRLPSSTKAKISDARDIKTVFDALG